MSLIGRVCLKQITEVCCKTSSVTCLVQPRRYQWNLIKVPKPGIKGKSYRRIVHFKDEYTVEPLEVTNLAGRDPVTGERINSVSLHYAFLFLLSSNVLSRLTSFI